jgi:O-antigen/teichoic acid export membrane protein
MLAPSAPSASKFWLALNRRGSLADLISLRYLLLRAWTAGGGLLAGLVQTFVFARVLDPERFSLFILVGALGVSMWLFDLGFSKIIFVHLRNRFLAGEETLDIGAQANAIAVLYAVAVAVSAVICALLMGLRPGMSLWHAAEFGLFFFFSAFNLTWFVLRNVCVAIDQYIYFETLEACRRVVYLGLMLAMLAGLPFSAFVILINVSWGVLIVLAGNRLIKRRALAPQLSGIVAHIRGFFREHRASALRTGTHAAGEVYFHSVLYLAVPLSFGLGAPTIVMDTGLKVFFGTLNLCSAACDLVVPRQTAGYSARDYRTVIRAKLLAMSLCALPALAIAALLLFDGKHLFALLLGHTAVMPATVTPILCVLLAAGVIKTPSNFLLQYTGHFKEIATLSIVNALLMTAAIGIGLVCHSGIVGLLAIYAAVFMAAALLYLGIAIRGPVRAARNGV